MLRSLTLPSIALLVALAMAAAYDLVRERPLNVILLTVESWRADSVLEEHMPHLLLESGPHGLQFTNHRTVSAWTAPNTIALLSGFSPFEQNAHTRGYSIPAELDTVSEQFARGGWQVTGLQSFMLIDLFKNLGLEIDSGADIKHWLASRARDRQPFYLWYHYLPTHLPYQRQFGSHEGLYVPPADEVESDPALASRIEAVATKPVIPAGSVEFEASDRRWVESEYLGGVRDFDEWFAEFWRFYRRIGLDGNTILVVTADHGEELLERGNVGHASTTHVGHLHEEIVRVPLFIWMPKDLLDVPPGSVFEHQTDHAMIAGMLKRLVGLEDAGSPRSSGGKPDWLPPSDDVWFALTSAAGFAEPDPERVNRFVAAASKGSAKVQVEVDDGQIVGVAGWNLRDDPGEVSPVPAPDETFQQLLALLEDKIASLPKRESDRDETNVGTDALAPRWEHPRIVGQVRYADIAGEAYLQWSGDADASHILEYEAGSGFLTLDGTIEVDGTRYDFGEIGKSYWSTWIVPYRQVRFRVRPRGGGQWSEWLELEFAK
ncbi:MAG: hypothetical protein CL566_09400 [Alphaproteobacteria bacterium]|nr:hypothetical protein [Alphaproteobacteria bacterium]